MNDRNRTGSDRHHETSMNVDKAKDEAKRTPDQAEGERDEDEKNTPNVGRTPGSAEGDRATVEEDLKNKTGSKQ